MLGFLFRGLTARSSTGAALFDSLTREARRPHWYIEGRVPDTLDGRFAILSSLTAMALVRFEQEGEKGNSASVALTERFIEVMESEHRELGLGDPSLGKTVRKLVGMLGRKTDLWRAAAAGELSWADAVCKALYGSSEDPDALRHSTAEIERFRELLERTDLAQLEQGRIA
jgi:cytochrome b pre-mRNA-processing protein 3